ncbi:translation initiation factor IF-2-like [Ailuropoda melanoleuca]|uniref:translation initiation factor IF-2-like n=1 Tax=Ailuropoda melanoleuca TaxID=9646 RepID=UPI00149491D2|nr:translation initiation factor IF-2-like [Ailuropoda melanoleuca]
MGRQTGSRSLLSRAEEEAGAETVRGAPGEQAVGRERRQSAELLVLGTAAPAAVAAAAGTPFGLRAACAGRRRASYGAGRAWGTRAVGRERRQSSELLVLGTAAPRLSRRRRGPPSASGPPAQGGVGLAVGPRAPGSRVADCGQGAPRAGLAGRDPEGKVPAAGDSRTGRPCPGARTETSETHRGRTPAGPHPLPRPGLGRRASPGAPASPAGRWSTTGGRPWAALPNLRTGRVTSRRYTRARGVGTWGPRGWRGGGRSGRRGGRSARGWSLGCTPRGSGGLGRGGALLSSSNGRGLNLAFGVRWGAAPLQEPGTVAEGPLAPPVACWCRCEQRE